MIIDKIENSKLYLGINTKFEKAFKYLISTDLINLPSGKYQIENDDIFAIVQDYQTKDRSEGKLEGHIKHIDVQYIISGIEHIGVTTLKNQTPIIINEEEDYIFYEGDSNLVRMDSGMFAIFFPHDLHMPGVKLDKASFVKKVVVKLKI